jgi:hypothetical protein
MIVKRRDKNEKPSDRPVCSRDDSIGVMTTSSERVTAVRVGRSAFLSGPMTAQKFAVPSTPEIGRPFESTVRDQEVSDLYRLYRLLSRRTVYVVVAMQ